MGQNEPAPSKLTVAVTGASGYLGGRLVRVLCADDKVDRIVGFDVRPSQYAHPKLVFDEIDVRNSALEARLQGVDVLVHLAFIMDPIKDEALMRDVNVNGSQNIFNCAGSAGVKKIVYTSSATVYGAHTDNDFPLTEESPLRANLDFSYSAHKLEVEYVVKEFRGEYPDVIVTVFRPAIVFGAHVDNAWSHILEMPVITAVKGYRPPFQFVHEDDVASALAFAVFTDLDGAYNLAPGDHISSDEILASLGRRRIDLPEAAAFALTERMWSAGLSEAPAGMLHYVMYPWVVSPAKLEAAGFECTRESAEVFAEAARHIKPHVRVGSSRVRRANVLRGATAGIGLAGAILGLRAVRRARS